MYQYQLKAIRQTKEIEFKTLQTKHDVLKTLWRKFKSSVNLFTLISTQQQEEIKHLYTNKKNRKAI